MFLVQTSERALLLQNYIMVTLKSVLFCLLHVICRGSIGILSKVQRQLITISVNQQINGTEFIA